MKRTMIAATATLVVLSFSLTAFAATRTQGQTGIRTQIKSGTCVK